MRVSEIIAALASTTKRTKKEEILREHQTNKWLVNVIRWTYEPLDNYGIIELGEFWKGNKHLEDLSLCDTEILFNRLKSRVYTGNVAKYEVLNHFTDLAEEDIELVRNIFRRDLRCGINIKSIETVFPGMLSAIEVQLAKKYDPEKNYNVGNWFATPKYDGLRGLFLNGKLYSRNNKPFVGFEDIEAELAEICEEYDLNCVDGELFSKEYTFQELQSMILTKKGIHPTIKKEIQYVIFAIRNANADNQFSTPVMYRTMQEIAERYYGTRLVFLEAVQIHNNPTAIQAFTNLCIEQGFEGSVLRNPYKSYVPGRSDYLLKVKMFEEEDLTVVNVFEGAGKYVGKLGGVICETIIDGVQIKTEVGSGFSDEEREEFWKHPETIVGKTIEVKYQNLTDLKEDGTKSLRFATFRRLKLDR